MNNDNKYLLEAIEEYEHKIESGEDFYMDASVLMDIEAFYEKNNREYDVERIMRFAERLHPESEDVLIVKAYRLKAKGNWAEAQKIIKNIPNQAHRDVQLFYAEQDIAASRTSQAIHRITDCLPAEMHEEDYDWFLDLAEIMVDYGFIKRAIGLLLTIPRKYKFRRRVDELLTECFYTMNEFEKCREIVNQMIDDTPYDAETWIHLADIQQKCNMMEDSIQSCDYALAIDEKNSRAMILKIYAYSCLKSAEETLRLCNECIRILPNNYDFYLRAGEQLFALNQTENSLNHFQEALKLCPVDSPDRARIIGNLAYIYVAEGCYTEAEDILFSCLSGGSPFDPYMQLANLMFAFNATEQAVLELTQAVYCPGITEKEYMSIAQLLVENKCFDEASQLWYTLSEEANSLVIDQLHAYVTYAMYKLKDRESMERHAKQSINFAADTLMKLFCQEMRIHDIEDLLNALDLHI